MANPTKMTFSVLHDKEIIEKEEHLRLRWYLKNEAKIRSAAEPKTENVKGEQERELMKYQVQLVEDGTKRKIRHTFDPEQEEPNVDPDQYVVHAAGIMRPVLIDVNSMIYKQGRVPYLKKRAKSLPNDRYYNRITTSFDYGWKMWDCAKTMQRLPFGKKPIIRDTFYRRRAGIEQDPSWYRQPMRLSPTICTE